jgi:hypothetical protein
MRLSSLVSIRLTEGTGTGAGEGAGEEKSPPIILLFYRKENDTFYVL